MRTCYALSQSEDSSANRSQWLRSVTDVTGDIISIDGKFLRRALTKDCKMPCIVSAHSSRTKLVIGQVKADEKSNEITAIPTLLDLLYLKGAIVTTDAAGCQKRIVRKILKRGAGYVISLKGNHEASLRTGRCVAGCCAAETLPTHQKIVLPRVSGEKDFLMRWP